GSTRDAARLWVGSCRRPQPYRDWLLTPSAPSTPPLLNIGGLAHYLPGAILQRRVPYLLKASSEAVWGTEIWPSQQTDRLYFWNWWLILPSGRCSQMPPKETR